MDSKLSSFVLDTFNACFNLMNGPLNNYHDFSNNLSRKIKTKAGGNEQFSFDVVLDGLIKNKIREHGIAGRIYSEESGFFDEGELNYRLVYDPFCNSSLASKTFREGAAGLSIFTPDYKLLITGILDYQTGIVGLAESDKPIFYQIQNGQSLSLSPSNVTKLSDAWVVITLENAQERQSLDQALPMLKKAKRVLISSGHIYWLKLVAGQIDAYADPYGGEKLYEMFASALAQAAGCVVTDRNGENFDAGKYLKIFEENPDFIYFPIASATAELHKELLESLTV